MSFQKTTYFKKSMVPATAAEANTFFYEKAVELSPTFQKWKTIDVVQEKLKENEGNKLFYGIWLERFLDEYRCCLFMHVFNESKNELYGNDGKWERKSYSKADDAENKFNKSFA